MIFIHMIMRMLLTVGGSLGHASQGPGDGVQELVVGEGGLLEAVAEVIPEADGATFLVGGGDGEEGLKGGHAGESIVGAFGLGVDQGEHLGVHLRLDGGEGLLSHFIGEETEEGRQLGRRAVVGAPSHERGVVVDGGSGGGSRGEGGVDTDPHVDLSGGR